MNEQERKNQKKETNDLENLKDDVNDEEDANENVVNTNNALTQSLLERTNGNLTQEIVDQNIEREKGCCERAWEYAKSFVVSPTNV